LWRQKRLKKFLIVNLKGQRKLAFLLSNSRVQNRYSVPFNNFSESWIGIGKVTVLQIRHQKLHIADKVTRQVNDFLGPEMNLPAT
jgi:hypothetical protein